MGNNSDGYQAEGRLVEIGSSRQPNVPPNQWGEKLCHHE